MKPFFEIFDTFFVSTYSLLVTIGIIVSLTIFWVRLVNRDTNKFESLYIVLSVFLFTFLCNKVLVGFEDVDNFKLNSLLTLNSGGSVLYSSVFAIFIFNTLYSKSLFKPNLKLYSAFIPAFLVGLALGKIGCFGAGCCYGIPYDGPFNIVFLTSSVAPNQIPVFPIQFLTIILASILACIYFFVLKNDQAVLIISFFIIYPLMRFITEFLRADFFRGFTFYELLSLSQVYSILFVSYGCILILMNKHWRNQMYQAINLTSNIQSR